MIISPVVWSNTTREGALRYDLPPNVTFAERTLLAFLINKILGKNASGFNVLSEGYPKTSVGTLTSSNKLTLVPNNSNSALIPLDPIEVTAGSLWNPNPPLIIFIFDTPPVAAAPVWL